MAKLGLAIDLGTSNIAGYIIDLDKPKDHFACSIPNSQTKHGLDVISRLTYAKAIESTKELQQLVVNDINNLIYVLCKRIRINRKRIDRIVISANTVMLHFLLGADPSGLYAFPYRSQLADNDKLLACDFGIVSSKSTKLVIIPAISPYVGGDITSGILYTGMHVLSSKKLLLDLGTNAEMVIGNKDSLFCTSAAAGPAFKSKNIPFGSKTIEIVASALQDAYVDKTGRVLDEHNFALSQDDVRAFQLAKAAVRAGIKILMDKSGISIDDIRKILIAGFFGEKINTRDAQVTGLLPQGQKNICRAIGNSSLGGAKKVLLKPELLKDVADIARKCRHIELSQQVPYQALFLKYASFS